MIKNRIMNQDSISVAILALVLIGVPLASAAPTSDVIGPSFNCAVARDPVSVMICADNGLKRRDIAFVQAYQALRHQLPEDQRAALRQDAIAFHNYVVHECGLPLREQVPTADRARATSCIDSAYARKRADYLRWLGREANEEALRDVREHIDLQGRLSTALGDATSRLPDGVYGPATRDSLRAFQARARLPQHGFLDNATADALRQIGGSVPPSFAPSAQGVPSWSETMPQTSSTVPGATQRVFHPAINTPQSAASPPGVPTSSIATLPCSAVSLRVVRETKWVPGSVLFGLPQERWTKDDYTALIARIDACMVENRDDPRNFVTMRRFIELRESSAPDPRGDEVRRAARAREEEEKAERARLEREEAERRRAAEEQRDAARAAEAQRQAETQRSAVRQAGVEAAAREPVFDCADRAILREVQRLLEERSNPLVTVRVVRLYDPGLTSEHRALSDEPPHMHLMYGDVRANTPEARNLLRVQLRMPRCTARVLTNQGESIVGYEKIERGGQLFLRVRDPRPGF